MFLLRIFICFVIGNAFLIWLPSACLSETLDEWIEGQRDASVRKLLAAIGRNGAVIASPDETTPGQNYYFHWVRDGALVMDVVVSLYEDAPDDEDRDECFELLESYTQFSRANQTTPQPQGFMGLGEPKFLVTGNVFPDANWPKPQNDGPALRTITLCRWGELLLADGQEALVQQLIKPVIMDDLTFTVQHWPDACKDVWEEVRGRHFYTRMVQRRALIAGADLLTDLGELGLAAQCQAQVAPLETAIAQHFNAGAGANYILATLQVENGPAGKVSHLDSVVVLAALHGETPGQPFFAPTDDRVLRTAFELTSQFRGLYGINQNQPADADGEPMEPAIGRYPEDTYDGANNQEGHPWFLTTAAMAELSYRAASRYGQSASIAITDHNRQYLALALQAAGHQNGLTAGETLIPADARFGALVSGLRIQGDRYLRRIRRHGAADGTLSEQYRRSSGFMTGAADLTWSYASVVTAIESR